LFTATCFFKLVAGHPQPSTESEQEERWDSSDGGIDKCKGGNQSFESKRNEQQDDDDLSEPIHYRPESDLETMQTDSSDGGMDIREDGNQSFEGRGNEKQDDNPSDPIRMSGSSDSGIDKCEVGNDNPSDPILSGSGKYCNIR
jgi:hypothetical protein